MMFSSLVVRPFASALSTSSTTCLYRFPFLNTSTADLPLRRCFASGSPGAPPSLSSLLAATLARQKTAFEAAEWRHYDGKIPRIAAAANHHYNRALQGEPGPNHFGIHSPGRWKHNRGPRGHWGTLMKNVSLAYLRSMKGSYRK